MCGEWAEERRRDGQRRRPSAPTPRSLVWRFELPLTNPRLKISAWHKDLVGTVDDTIGEYVRPHPSGPSPSLLPLLPAHRRPRERAAAPAHAHARAASAPPPRPPSDRVPVEEVRRDHVAPRLRARPGQQERRHRDPRAVSGPRQRGEEVDRAVPPEREEDPQGEGADPVCACGGARAGGRGLCGGVGALSAAPAEACAWSAGAEVSLFPHLPRGRRSCR